MAATQTTCSIARSLEVLGERWTFLILREALSGTTRFAEFRSALGVAPDVLSNRLATLVAAGVLEKRPYQEPGARARDSYHLTSAGRDLRVVLTALQQWGDEHRPYDGGPSVVRRTAHGGRPVRVAFVDDRGREVPPEEVEFVRTTASAASSSSISGPSMLRSQRPHRGDAEPRCERCEP